MDEKQLKNLYGKYVASKFIYRAVPKDQVKNYILNGVDPKIDYFKKIKPDVERLFQIIEGAQNLEYKIWWGQWVDQHKVIRTTRKDLANRWIDFTSKESNAKYYLKHPGGALSTTVILFNEEIKTQKILLSPYDKKVIEKLDSWAKNLRKTKNMILKFPATSSFFETAHFQHFSGPYKKSPLGSFENFQKAINLEGWDFYKPYLTGKKLYYLRVFGKIPKNIAQIIPVHILKQKK